MSGTLSRLRRVISGNVNAIIDDMESKNLDKVTDELLRESERDLKKLKFETASIVSKERTAKRGIERICNNAEKLMEYAEKAVLAGNDEDAKQFLAERERILSGDLKLAEGKYIEIKEGADSIRALHDTFESETQALSCNRNAIDATTSCARAKEVVDKAAYKTSGLTALHNEVARMEEKAYERLDKANVMLELNPNLNRVLDKKKGIKALQDKYDSPDAGSPKIQEQLEEIKLRLGLEKKEAEVVA